MTLRRLPVLLVAAAFIAPLAGACASRDSSVDAADVVRSDSAGVRLVTSGSEDRALTWTFADVDVLRDSAGEPWLFESLRRQSVLTDRGGRTYVLTRDKSIVRFGREGRHERTIGRAGGGPGELEFPTAIGSQGDSIFAFEAIREQLVRWGPGLDPITSLPLTGALASIDAIAFRSGGLWMHKREFTEGVYTLSLYGDTLGGPPLHRVVQPKASMIRMCNGGISLPPFFSPVIRWTANGPRILANSEPAYVLWLYEGSRPIASVRRSITPRAPVAADADLAMPEGLRVVFGNASAPCEMAASELFAQTGAAPLLPLVQDVILLADGTFWVERSLSGEQSVVDAFAADGAYAGTMRGMPLPLGRLPNGELLLPREDAASGGFFIARVKVTK